LCGFTVALFLKEYTMAFGRIANDFAALRRTAFQHKNGDGGKPRAGGDHHRAAPELEAADRKGAAQERMRRDDRARHRLQSSVADFVSRKPRIKTKELKNVSLKHRGALTLQISQELHDEFKQDDARYESVESTRDVVKERSESNAPNEKILVRYEAARKLSLGARKEHKLVATGSLVALDEPAMPQYGKGWLADLVTKEDFRKQGHGASMIEGVAKLASKAGVEGGVKLYAEQENKAYYAKRGFHEIGQEAIPDEGEPGETIPVTVFSTEAPKKAGGAD
jgi:N-acetylglutamate synthase-like GNAT family acetyltransferase